MEASAERSLAMCSGSKSASSAEVEEVGVTVDRKMMVVADVGDRPEKCCRLSGTNAFANNDKHDVTINEMIAAVGIILIGTGITVQEERNVNIGVNVLVWCQNALPISLTKQ